MERLLNYYFDPGFLIYQKRIEEILISIFKNLGANLSSYLFKAFYIYELFCNSLELDQPRFLQLAPVS